MRDPGAALTRAEAFRLKTRTTVERARDLYQEREDDWIKANAERLEAMGAGWKILLRDEQRTGGLLTAHRLWKRARRWARVGEFVYQARKRAYFDHREFGTGG